MFSQGGAGDGVSLSETQTTDRMCSNRIYLYVLKIKICSLNVRVISVTSLVGFLLSTMQIKQILSVVGNLAVSAFINLYRNILFFFHPQPEPESMHWMLHLSGTTLWDVFVSNIGINKLDKDGDVSCHFSADYEKSNSYAFLRCDVGSAS